MSAAFDKREAKVRVPANIYWRMFKFVEANDRPTTSDLAWALNMEIEDVRWRLQRLVKTGFVSVGGREGRLAKVTPGEQTWVARNAYGAAMLAKPFPAPRGFLKSR